MGTSPVTPIGNFWNGQSYGMSERPQECDQLFSFLRFQLQAEFMALDRARFPARRAPPAWEMGFLQPVRVEHLFQARNGSIVQVMPAIPQPLERRHFVVARPFAGFQCQTSVCANRDRKNVEAGPPIVRRSKPIREGQLVIRIERRSVTADATFALKDLLSSPRLLIGAIRVDRRLERVHVQRESIEGLVWQTFLYPLRIRGKACDMGQNRRFPQN